MKRSESQSVDKRAAPSNTLNQGSSDVFIKLALEQISNSKEAKKLQKLKDSCKNALTTLETATKTNVLMDYQTLDKIFSPFQLACQSRLPALVSISIDCLGKLFSYNFWGKHEYFVEDQPDDDMDEDPKKKSPSKKSTEDRDSMDAEPAPSGGGGIMGLVIDTICDSFAGAENTDEKVQMQIVKVQEN